MFEFYCKESQEANDEGMTFTILCDPFGHELFRSQYSYMPRDKASDLNRATEQLREKYQEQAEEIATLQSALSASQEALAEARKFVRSTFPLEHPSDIRYANKDAAILLAKWDSVVDTTESEEREE